MKPILKLDNVCKYYASSKNITMGLSKINLSLYKGEFVAITGESGSGKTTLLNVIAGLDSYEEGELYYNGEPTSYYDKNDWDDYRKNKISFIFQSYNLIDSYTALENVETVLYIQGYKKEDARNKAIELLKQVGLEERQDHRATELSSGQKQRLAIARALAKNTDIIVADEPTGNLDIENGNIVLKLLKELSKDKLVLLVTHNYEQAEPFVSRKIRLFDGAIKSDITLNGQNIIELSDVKDKQVKDKRSFKKDFKLASRVTGLNLKSQPRKSLSVFSLSLFSILATFVCVGLFAAGYDYSNVKEYDDSAYLNGDRTRIVSVKADNQDFTENEINSIKQLSPRIKQVERYGAANDINYFLDDDIEFKFHVGDGPDAEAAYKDMIFKDYSHYVKSTTCLTQDDLSEGHLPSSREEIVLYSKDKSLLGKEINVFFLNGQKWNRNGSSTYNYRYKLKVVGLLKDKQDQVYFSPNLTRSLASSAYNKTINLNFRYEETGKNYIYSAFTNGMYFVEDPLLKGNEIRVSHEFFEAFGLNTITVPYENYKDLSYIQLNGNEIKVTVVDNPHLSCKKIVEVSPDFFSQVYGTLDDQLGVYINDYAHTNQVLNTLDKNGYRSISVFKFSTIDWDYDKVTKRFILLGLCVFAVIIVSLLEVVIGKALMKFKKNDFIIFRSLGMSDRTIKTCNYLELFTYNILSTFIITLIFNILYWCNVNPIRNILGYMNVGYYFAFFMIIIAVTFIEGYVYNKYLDTQLKTVVSLKED